MSNSICPHCNKEIQGNKKVFANHVRWCVKNPKYLEIKNNTIYKIKKHYIEKFGEYKDFEVCCEKCGKIFVVNEQEKLHPIKKHYYCSKSCSNTRILTDETKQKISNSLNLSDKINHKKEYIHICPYCNKEYKTFRKNKKYCSRKCAYIGRYYLQLKDKIQNPLIFRKYYRLQCKFKFSINNFKEEFDFNKIQIYGWYKPANKGNNLNGISRDHKYSINDGLLNNIDPYYISHPANCELLTQNENASKHSKSSISIDDLYRLVDKWNKKYGIYENLCDYSLFPENYTFHKKFMGYMV